MGCGCKKRREKMARAFSAAARKLTGREKVTPAEAHRLATPVSRTRRKSVGLGG